jgi:hypothetical protein
LTGFIDAGRFENLLIDLYSGATGYDSLLKEYKKPINEDMPIYKRMASLLQLPYEFELCLETSLGVSHIPTDLLKAINNPVGSDVIVLVQQRSIFCHKVRILRSLVNL